MGQTERCRFSRPVFSGGRLAPAKLIEYRATSKVFNFTVDKIAWLAARELLVGSILSVNLPRIGSIMARLGGILFQSPPPRVPFHRG